MNMEEKILQFLMKRQYASLVTKTVAFSKLSEILDLAVAPEAEGTLRPGHQLQIFSKQRPGEVQKAAGGRFWSGGHSQGDDGDAPEQGT